MDNLVEMKELGLLNEEQYQEIAAWFNSPLTNAEVLAMPHPLWVALNQSTVLLSFDPEKLGLLPN